MRVDATFYGTAPMPDAGAGPPRPVDRRVTNDDVLAAYRNLEQWCRTMDRLGYDTAWFTEHHFQYEGYEVLPNLVQMGVHCAGFTERLRFGQMFNVVPQWHPLRLAEDFALADVLTGGRMEFGVGRGTVPREAWSLGAVVASGDNDMSREADQRNRELFEEAMAVIKLAWTQERFAYHGRHFSFPPPDIPDRGTKVEHLTLLPRPTRPIPVYQAVSSPATAEYVAREGHRGVWMGHPPAAMHDQWERFGELAAAHGRELDAAVDRVLVLILHTAPTREEAVRAFRDPWDELVKFLSQYGRYQKLAPPGVAVPFDHRPSLEEAIERGVVAVGSPDDVAERIAGYRDLLDLGHLVAFVELPGLSQAQVDDQLHLLAEEVLPRMGVRLRAAAAAA